MNTLFSEPFAQALVLMQPRNCRNKFLDVARRNENAALAIEHLGN
jgi:hypothetical protein